MYSYLHYLPTHINKSAQHFPTLKIDFYFLYTECGGLRARGTHTPYTDQEPLTLINTNMSNIKSFFKYRI